MNGKIPRILLVDDDIHLLKLGEKIIERLGYNVISQQNAKDALEIFKDLPSQFDLVITDYRMPQMTGAELSEEILKISPDMPIILCSGYSSDFGEQEAAELGIGWFMRKPLMNKDFATLIEKALASK